MKDFWDEISNEMEKEKLFFQRTIGVKVPKGKKCAFKDYSCIFAKYYEKMEPETQCDLFGESIIDGEKHYKCLVMCGYND